MFEDWEDFYLLIGGAAGSLIGLLFVVASLTAGLGSSRSERGAKLFMTPTVFDFAVIVVISAMAMAPRLGPETVGALLGAAALIALIYTTRNVIALGDGGATDHWTDFWFYGAAPLACHVALAALAVAAWRAEPLMPALLAALLVILLLLSIRNAWDLVTWIAPRVQELKQQDKSLTAKGHAMTSDLWALVATIFLAMAQLSAASILSLRQLGGAWILSARDQPREATGLAGRVVRAHRNLLEIFPQFAAALFVVHAAGANADLSVVGAWTFFSARALYAPAYVFAPPGVRPLCWTAAQAGVVIVLADLVF